MSRFFSMLFLCIFYFSSFLFGELEQYTDSPTNIKVLCVMTNLDHEVYRGIWNIPLIKETLTKHLNEEKYNFVFVLLPHENTHGHHKAATVLTLEAVNNMESTKRPIVLGVDTPKDTPEQFSELSGF